MSLPTDANPKRGGHATGGGNYRGRGTDAHCLTFWRRPAAMTAELPWTSVSVATGYRRNLRVSTASAMAHGTSTANATDEATARAVVLSVAKSVVPIMATHGSPRQLPRQFPRPSAAIATETRQSPQKFAEVHGNCHGSFRGRPTAAKTTIRGHPRPSAAIATAII